MRKDRLSALAMGEAAIVRDLEAAGAMGRRLLDIGLTPGSSVVALFKSASGDPTAYLIAGAVIALRREDAETVLISTAEDGEDEENGADTKPDGQET